MKRYFNLLFSLLRYAMKSDLEYRFNAVGNFVYYTFSLGINLFFINIFFSYVGNFNGWTKPEAFFLTGVFRVILAIEAVMLRGIFMIPHYIMKAYLDLLLAKPINSQCYTSLRFPRILALLEIIPGLVIIFYALINMQRQFNLLDILFLVISLILGSIIFYSILFSLATLSIWFKSFYSFPDLYYIIREPLGIPIDILGKTTSFALTFIIPLGFIITIPVKIFLGKEPLFFIVFTLGFTTLLFYFSIWFWNFSLRHYTSASS